MINTSYLKTIIALIVLILSLIIAFCNLTQESKYPVDAKRYRTVLEAVKKHYEEMPEPERRKITGVEKKKFRKLMEDLNQAIEDLSRAV